MRVPQYLVASLCLSISLWAQSLPDAPSTAQPPQAKPVRVSHCGPSFLGGCWDVHAPRRSNWTVIKDPYFWGPTAADAIFTSLDGAVTSYGLSHSPCEEANHDLGSHPSDARIAGINALMFGATTGFRFAALKAIPKDSHSRWAWIPRAFSIGTAARSAQVHISGAMSWFSSGCL
jgi:hypothetical protein